MPAAQDFSLSSIYIQITSKSQEYICDAQRKNDYLKESAQ